MQWNETPESSNIARFAYDSDKSVLTVQFLNGATYNYFDVPAFIFEEMRVVPSKGQFLAYAIKGNYRYARI
jgi:hypothetical protein